MKIFLISSRMLIQKNEQTQCYIISVMIDILSVTKVFENSIYTLYLVWVWTRVFGDWLKDPCHSLSVMIISWFGSLWWWWLGVFIPDEFEILERSDGCEKESFAFFGMFW